MQTVSETRAHGGVQGVYAYASSACNCEMTFAVFVPPQAESQACPVIWYLSGLTCNHTNVTDKGEYRQMAAEMGIIIVCPDTSPRGDDVPDEPDNWQFGKGAGFYLNATQEPFNKHYNMYDYLVDELPKLIGEKFNADMSRQSIMGHSMGGHGALTIALKNPNTFRSCSAFAPICRPSEASWSKPSFEKYLGTDEAGWRQYDACDLIVDGNRFSPILVDQGDKDQFMEEGCRPQALAKAVRGTEIDATIRIQEGYDHSYFFISTFMPEHIAWHADHLK
ncbi:S-formylglutathione hydrolase [Maritalea sp.]|uniref:S-formylglutathione hydrolase n=1 Tax=Maritalea sp. TaxID=2003361 RepID=UPI003EF97E32